MRLFENAELHKVQFDRKKVAMRLKCGNQKGLDRKAKIKQIQKKMVRG